MDKIEAQGSLQYLTDMAYKYNVAMLCEPVLNDNRFILWSGSGRFGAHHYGDHGLVIHTAEVVRLCLLNNLNLDAGIEERSLFCAALFHDTGKMWDYQKVEDVWGGTPHKRKIHHISRSALTWQSAVDCLWRLDAKIEWPTQADVDEILHAILAHHGLREWGSPVAPKSKMAWMLHLCDGISARMSDAESWDCVHDKK